MSAGSGGVKWCRPWTDVITLRFVRDTRPSTIFEPASWARSFSALACALRSRFTLSRSSDSACSVVSALSLSSSAASEYSAAYIVGSFCSKFALQRERDEPYSQYSYGNEQISQYCTSRAGKRSSGAAAATSVLIVGVVEAYT